MIDSKEIKYLHPTLQRAANELIKRCKQSGIRIIITSTYRDNEYQNTLYAKGRMTAGKIITNARGGESIHNYALAFDFAPLLSNGQIDWSGKDPQWRKVGEIGAKMGLEWGGNWKGFVDLPHFQFTNGLTIKQLQQGKKVPQDCKMKWEIEELKKDDDEEMIKELTVLYNGSPVVVESSFKNDTNYVKLRDLEKFGFKVSYDEAKKLPALER